MPAPSGEASRSPDLLFHRRPSDQSGVQAPKQRVEQQLIRVTTPSRRRTLGLITDLRGYSPCDDKRVSELSAIYDAPQPNAAQLLCNRCSASARWTHGTSCREQ